MARPCKAERRIDGFDPVEAVYAERNDRNGIFFSVDGVVNDLEGLTVREGYEMQRHHRPSATHAATAREHPLVIPEPRSTGARRA